MCSLTALHLLLDILEQRILLTIHILVPHAIGVDLYIHIPNLIEDDLLLSEVGWHNLLLIHSAITRIQYVGKFPFLEGGSSLSGHIKDLFNGVRTTRQILLLSIVHEYPVIVLLVEDTTLSCSSLLIP